MYFINRALSQSGQGVFMVGLLLLAGGSQSGAVGLSTVFVAMMAGSLLCALPAGAITDRLGAPRALFAGASGRLAIIALVLLLPMNPVTLAVIAFGYSAASQLFSPAELALVPTISARQPANVHAKLVALQYGGQAAGFAAIAPLALLLGGATLVTQLALAIYVAVAVISGMLAIRLPFVSRVRSTRQTFSFGPPVRYFMRGTSAGYAGILLAFGELASKAMFVAVPVYLSDELSLGTPGKVMLIAPAVVGGLVGLAWGSRSLHISMASSTLRHCLLATVRLGHRPRGAWPHRCRGRSDE